MNESTQQTIASESSIQTSSVGSCLEPLLEALNWNGTKRQFREALPHLSTLNTITMFCKVMEHLNFQSSQLNIKLNTIDPRIFPCLYVTETGSTMVIINKKNGHYLVFDGETKTQIIFTTEEVNKLDLKGKAYIFKPKKMIKHEATLKGSWVTSIFYDNKPLIYNTAWLALLLNLLTLAASLFVMAIYNNVITTHSIETLKDFSIGILLIIIGIILLQQIKSKALTILCSRVKQHLESVIFKRLIESTPSELESSTLRSQTAWQREFDDFRDLLSKPVLSYVFELPFLWITLVAIAILGGYLVFIPICFAFVICLVGLLLYPAMKQVTTEANHKDSNKTTFLIDAARHYKAIRSFTLEKIWGQRYRELSAEINITHFRKSILNSVIVSTSKVLIIFSELVIVGTSVIMIKNEHLSIALMIVIMLLNWLFLIPITTLFRALPLIHQGIKSFIKINRLMKIKSESQNNEVTYPDRQKLNGNIRFHQVNFHYSSNSGFALIDINLQISAGTLVAVTGQNDAGKSTLLKILLGLYHPQNGKIFIDHCELKQLNPIALRNSISYLPQSPELFTGTIAENLQFAQPGATDMEMRYAAKQAGVIDDILTLPKGFNTFVTNKAPNQLSLSFKQRLCLARALLQNNSIILLDAPTTFLNSDEERIFFQTLNELKGKVTFIVATQSFSLLKRAEHILFLKEGQLILNGSADAVLLKISEDFA